MTTHPTKRLIRQSLSLSLSLSGLMWWPPISLLFYSLYPVGGKSMTCFYATSAMVTSTSTPGSMLMLVICLTTSGGEYKSINLLWTLISNLSQVLVPSPQGDFLVVIQSFLVGSLTGPLTLSFLLLAPLIKSLQTFSKFLTCLEVKVILILWIVAEASSSYPGFPILVAGTAIWFEHKKRKKYASVFFTPNTIKAVDLLFHRTQSQTKHDKVQVPSTCMYVCVCVGHVSRKTFVLKTTKERTSLRRQVLLRAHDLTTNSVSFTPPPQRSFPYLWFLFV